MSGMRFGRAFCLAAVVAIVFISLVVYSIDAAGTGSRAVSAGKGAIRTKRDAFKLPKLFDFSRFKQMFKKTYGSVVEELVRQKLFITRAIRTFISGLKYKRRNANYYLALNQMSDWTAAEFKKLELVPDTRNNDASVTLDKVDGIVPQEPAKVDISEIEKSLKEAESQFVSRVVGESNSSRRRRRRSVASGNDRSSFSIDVLADRPLQDPLPKETKAKVQLKPPSNNPDYEPPEVRSYGWSLPTLNIDWSNFLPTDPTDESSSTESGAIGGLMSAIGRATGSTDIDALLKEILSKYGNTDTEMVDALPDEVFFDHRDSHCMNEVQNQGGCGSCYAFATNAYLEWLLCKQTSKLVRLSEQYIVDCAPQSELGYNLHGCNGGSPYGVVKYSLLYGTELHINYPYMALEGMCPYEADEHREKMGYLRFGPELGRSAGVPMKHWAKFIKFAPMLIKIGTQGDIMEYGGGVHSGETCCLGLTEETCGTHWVLLIGHGREDGEEYWLVRNSWSPAWGDRGNYKLSKKAKHCVPGQMGFFYSTDNGVDFDLKYLDFNKNRTDEVQGRINNIHRYTATRKG